MKQLRNCLAAAAALVLATRAEAYASPDKPIIVVGKSVNAKNFVAQLSPTSGDSQLAKFNDALCPAVFGVQNGDDALIANRIRTVAAAVGAPVDKQRCKPNLLLLVVSNKNEILDYVRSHRPDLLGRLTNAEIRRLFQSADHTASWNVSRLVGADGSIVQYKMVKFDPQDAPFVTAVTTGFMSSRIKSMTIPAFVASIVVIEADAARALTPMQLADFTVMRALTGTSPAAPQSASILSVMHAVAEQAEAPLSVTRWDLALLKGLYSTSNAVSASSQRASIMRRIQRDLSDPQR